MSIPTASIFKDQFGARFFLIAQFRYKAMFNVQSKLIEKQPKLTVISVPTVLHSLDCHCP